MGRRSAVFVRVLHAMIRHTLLPHPEGDRDRLAMPISQFAGTGTLPLSSFAPGMRLKLLGYRLTDADVEAMMFPGQPAARELCRSFMDTCLPWRTAGVPGNLTRETLRRNVPGVAGWIDQVRRRSEVQARRQAHAILEGPAATNRKSPTRPSISCSLRADPRSVARSRSPR
ncbi:hypothetical protein [Streptomyces sp. NPDC056660]|uniref:hypothetical protein n=1 Tax=Streptomyces sp. NPDC056660 TaxID=3345897 RepID=UPI0036B9A48E